MAIHAYYHVTPTGAGAKTGAGWATAMDEAAFEAFIEGGGLAAGDVVFIKEGTYTLDSAYNSSAVDGTATSPIAFIGVLSGTTHEGADVVDSDWATGANRPFFDCVTFTITCGDYYIWNNIYFQGSAANTVTPGFTNRFWNCKFDQDNGASASRYVLNVGSTSSGTNVINCEFLSANASGVSVGASRVNFIDCYFHNFADATNGVGILLGANSINVISCIFNSIANVAINVNSRVGCIIRGNTFYETNVSVSGTTGSEIIAQNNILDGNNGHGFLWTTQTDINFYYGNHGDDSRCTDMWDGVDDTTVFKDQRVTTGDPLFVNTSSDLSLQKTSPCRGVAQDAFLGVGATVKHGNKGAWQGYTTRSTVPTVAQVVNVAGGGPALWDEYDSIGPGEVTAEAHDPDEVVDTAGGDYVTTAVSDVKLGVAFGADGSEEGTYAGNNLYIRALSPATGSAEGGYEVTMTAVNAGATQGTGSVKIDGVAQSIVSWADGIIVFTMAAHAVGPVTARLTADNGNINDLADAFEFTAADVPRNDYLVPIVNRDYQVKHVDRNYNVPARG